MFFELLGFRRIVAKSNGVHYIELYLMSDDTPNVIGHFCTSIFIREDRVFDESRNIYTNVKPGDACRVFYNQYGKVDSVEFVE